MKVVVETIEIDRPTINNRIYTREAMEKAVELYNKKIKSNGGCFVTLDSPESSSVELSDVAGIVKECVIDDKHMVIEVEPMNNYKGKILKDLMAHKAIDFTPNIIGSIEARVESDRKEFSFIPDLIGKSSVEGNLVNIEEVISFSTVPKH